MVAPPAVFKATGRAGFTLVEMSIGLVIIGLIIGGVLVGRDLISAATIRAQISQIEKYNSAVNTFRGKYGYLPGDIPDPTAQQYGFAARGSAGGQGDGDGVIEGGYGPNGVVEIVGETVMFWADLSTAGMIAGGFNLASSTAFPNRINGTLVGQYFPEAKIGHGNYIYVWSGGSAVCCSYTWVSTGINYYGISVVSDVSGVSGGGNEGYMNSSNAGLTVYEANAIDTKMDDGSPQTGRVTAQYLASGNHGGSPYWIGVSPGTAAASSSSTCYDNGGNASNLMRYSMSQSNGTGINCALSFQF